MRERLNSIQQMLLAASPDTGDNSTPRARITLVVFSLLVLTLLAWTTWDHIHARLQQEHAVGAHVATGIVGDLERRMEGISSRLASFVSQERALLESVTATPDSAELRKSLWSLLQLVFPAVRATLVFDARGNRGVAIGDAAESISGSDLRELQQGRGKTIRIRGDTQPAGIDFGTAWNANQDGLGALLINFSCSSICPALELAAPEGHQLWIHRDPTPAPASDNSAIRARSPAQEAQGQVVAVLPISETGWVLEDRLDPAYVSQLVRSRTILALGLGVAFLLAAAALYRWIGYQSSTTREQGLDLRESRLKLEAILSATTDGIVLTNPQGRIELFNPAAEMMFGHLAEDVIDASIEELLPGFLSRENPAELLEKSRDDHAPPVVTETVGRRRDQDPSEFPARLWLSGVHYRGRPHLLVVVQDLSEHERNEQDLAFLEQRDVLTGLLNRKEFEHNLAQILTENGDGPDGPLVLCHVDVDQFKLVNDTCGHEAGDELLRQLSILVKAKLGHNSIIGRLGGDEFGILFRNRSLEAAREICDDFLQTVHNFLFTWSDQSFDIAVSIGMTKINGDGEGLSSILSRADVACQMAKANGRGRMHIYHEGDVELARHHRDMHLVSDLSQALSDGRFHLYAQPIVGIAPDAKQRPHYEVLVRMVDKDGSLVVPEQFIPAAERYIVMPAVDRWIINRLFDLHGESLRSAHRENPGSFLFAVNLSGTSITDEGFLQYLHRQFREWKVPYGAICFEITETAAVRNLKAAKSFMADLSARGCSFALDDFGTGLSSYSYLKELPVHFLKIDGSFVRGMADDRVNQALVKSINEIGHALELKTIAEWAEDESTLQELRALGVDFAQGFGVGAPVPVDDLKLANNAEQTTDAQESGQ